MIVKIKKIAIRQVYRSENKVPLYDAKSEIGVNIVNKKLDQLFAKINYDSLLLACSTQRSRRHFINIDKLEFTLINFKS